MKIGTLKSSPESSSVVWKDGKRQIRALLKKAGIKPTGTFRQRKENRGEYALAVEGGSVRAVRKPNADVTILKVKTISVENLSAAQLAAILAQG